MYKELIRSIQGAAAFNLDNADKADVQRSYYTAGMVKAFTEVLRGLGHEVETGTWDDIDGVVLVKNSKIDFDGYGELLKK